RIAANQEWSSEHPTQVVAVGVQVGASEQVVHVPVEYADVEPPPVEMPAEVVKPVHAAPKRGSAQGSGDKAAPANDSAAKQARDPDREKYEAAAALEARDWKAALASYLELARGQGRWAQVALYAAGRLAADRHDRRAQTFLEVYLHRFPDGANAADAR